MRRNGEYTIELEVEPEKKSKVSSKPFLRGYL
jgi:hypothetical protein